MGVRCLLLTGLMRTVTVVVLGVGEEHRLKMPAIDDEQPVQDFAAQRPDQSFADRVRPRRLRRTLENPNVFRRKDCVGSPCDLLIALKVLRIGGI